MVSVPPLALLFLIQFLVIFAGLTTYLFFRSRKAPAGNSGSRGEPENHAGDNADHERDRAELARYREMLDKMEEKFNQVKSANEKLKDSLDTLIPEAERSKEYKQLIAELEQSNQELSGCIETLQKDNAQMTRETRSRQDEVRKLTMKLEASVSKEAYDNLSAQKKSLELKFNKLESDLKDKSSEYETLQKNYLWLEKEYNALYDNIKEEGPD